MSDYWFFPNFAPFERPYEKTGILIKRKILSKQTKYQKMEIIDSYLYGKVLVLDGIIQITEKDEFLYHEMMVHVPFLYHGNVQKVLIIGGGDGGVLKQAIKHPIKEACLVDIDKEVTEMIKKYIPSICGKAFEDKRSKVFFEDGLKFIKGFRDYFDVVIIDLTDPSGPSKTLYSPKFYKDVHLALKNNGLVLTQTGTFPSMKEGLKMVRKNLKEVFPYVKTHLGMVNSFGVGLCSYTIGSKVSLNADLKTIQDRFAKLKLNTKYYNPEIHIATGILPNFDEMISK
jgi:spermidine synthase